MKQEIEIEGLPEGWEVKEVKLPANALMHSNDRTISINNIQALVSIQKTKPRRIVLEEAVGRMADKVFHERDGTYTYWCEVKE